MFENGHSCFSALAKDICPTVFERFKKIIKEHMEKQNERISKLEPDNCLLQEQMMILKHANLQMENRKEELEQYGRRICVRINRIPVKSNETSDYVLKYVKDMFDEGEMDIPDTDIDRAHCIGPEYSDYKTKRKCNAVIIKFTTFRHKTLVSRARKKNQNLC